MTFERYTKDHIYLRPDGDIGIIGITHYGQSTLGQVKEVGTVDIEPGTAFKKGDNLGYVGTIQITAPVDLEVVESNSNLKANPSLINSDPMAEGWLLIVKVTDRAQLEDKASFLTWDAYQEYLQTVENASKGN